MSDAKPKVAFFDFTCCEGCQLTVVDSLQDHVELLDAIEIVNFREAMSEKGEDYLIAFVEGSCSRPADEERLRKIRDQAAILVALGACSHLGGVNTVRNWQDLEDVRKYVYGDKADWYDTYPARPIDQVVKVDAVVPGCPIDPEEFIKIVKQMLQGRMPVIADNPMCVECKMKENVCLYEQGKVCLGPITQAGCGVRCPTYGNSCEGCRGMIAEPNIASMRQVMKEHGISDEDINAKLSLFLSYQMMELEKAGEEA